MTVATDMRDFYIDAERKVLMGQSVTFRGRVLTRANLKDIREGRQEWERKVLSERSRQSGGSSLYSVASFNE
jgi:hypothetical protein